VLKRSPGHQFSAAQIDTRSNRLTRKSRHQDTPAGCVIVCRVYVTDYGRSNQRGVTSRKRGTGASGKSGKRKSITAGVLIKISAPALMF